MRIGAEPPLNFSLPSGHRQWLESIEQALQESTFLVVLCSPKSVHRPRINFEASAAWMRKNTAYPDLSCPAPSGSFNTFVASPRHRDLWK